MGTEPQIASLIIQRIVIAMIDYHPVWGLHNDAMHTKYCLLPFSLLGISHGIALTPIPFPLIEIVIVCVVHQCHLALSKWDFFHNEGVILLYSNVLK